MVVSLPTLAAAAAALHVDTAFTMTIPYSFPSGDYTVSLICQHMAWHRGGVGSGSGSGNGNSSGSSNCSGSGSGSGSGNGDGIGMDDGSGVDAFPDVLDGNSTIFQQQQYEQQHPLLSSLLSSSLLSSKLDQL